MILYHVGVTLLVIWFVMRGNPRVDYRVAAIGALIPDLIDKPIGRIFFRDRFESGRIFGHTLLLNVIFLCVFFFMRGRHKRTLSLLPVASLLHLAEDGMFSKPRTLWWPLFGAEFPRETLRDWWWAPWVSSQAMIQEAIGLACLAWLLAAHGMLNRDGIRSFILTGHLEKETSPT